MRVPLGATAIPILPHTPLGRPLPVSWVQVVPPSVDLYRPLPGPPLSERQGRRRNWYIAAYTIWLLLGSNSTSTAPVLSSLYRTFFQVWPPSSERKRPRSALGPEACPMAATKTRLGSLGSIRTWAMCWVSSRPMCCQLLPASLDLHTPPSTEPK